MWGVGRGEEGEELSVRVYGEGEAGELSVGCRERGGGKGKAEHGV